MWVSFARSAIYLVALVFLMQVLRWVLNPLLEVARGGPNADAASVQRVSTYFGALTLDNLTLLVALAVGIYVLGRAATERNLG